MPLAPGRKKGIAYAKLLIRAGARVDEKDHFGWTPLCYAVHASRRTIVKILLREGAAFSATTMQDDPFPDAIGAVKAVLKRVEAAGGWKPYASSHKRVLVGLVTKCKPIPDEVAGLVVDFYCPSGGS